MSASTSRVARQTENTSPVDCTEIFCFGGAGPGRQPSTMKWGSSQGSSGFLSSLPGPLGSCQPWSCRYCGGSKHLPVAGQSAHPACQSHPADPAEASLLLQDTRQPLCSS